MKGLKSYSLLILSFLMILCFSFCIAINSVGVSVANASEEVVPFRVEDGASIRLENDDNGTYGIAFKAYVGDTAKESPIENATYKMIILPSILIDSYNAEDTQDNIVKWLNDYATSKGGSLAVATCTPNADGILKAAITDIYWVNLNRDFSAIAYYEVDGNIVEIAELATDGRRSIIDVAQNAINSGDYSDSQYADELEILQGFIADGNSQANNTVISSADESSLFSITTSDVTGDIEAVTDSEKDNAWKFTFKTKVNNNVHVALMYDNTLLQNRINGYDMVKFSVYSPKSGTLYACENDALTEIVAYKSLVEGWTEVYFAAKDIASAPYFIITYPELNSSYYITDFKAYTTSEAAEQVINLIKALDFSDEFVMFYGNDITEARNAYDALSEKAKLLVTNYSQLQKIEALYANYVVLADMSSKTGFAAFADAGMSDSSWISTGYDDTYQNYLSVNVPAVKDANIALTFTTTDLATKLDGCEKVYFYVYSPCTSKDRELLLKINGSYNAAGTRPLLAQQAWTKVELSVEDFMSLQVFGVYSGQYDGPCEYKFSQIYAVKSSLYTANYVIALINALPADENLIPFYGADISAARTAYDNLTASEQNAVTNYAQLVNIEKVYQNIVVLADMSSKTGFTLNTSDFGNGNSVSISTGVDETYNNYLSLNVIADATHDHLSIKYNANNYSASLTDCDYVYFYIYNGGNVDRKVLANFGGGSTVTSYGGIVLKAREWTEVKVSKDDFISGTHFGIAYVSDSKELCEYKVSMIYAVKASS